MGRKRYFVVFAIFAVSVAHAQWYPFINTSNMVGVGYRVGKVSPFAGLNFGCTFFRDYIGDSVTNSYGSHFNFISLIGANYYLAQGSLAPFVSAFIGHTFYIYNNWTLTASRFNMQTSIGIGLEKKIQAGLAITAECCIGYSMSKFSGTIWQQPTRYFHSFGIGPIITVKYYF